MVLGPENKQYALQKSCYCPISLLLKSRLFISYKNHSTVKGRGAITFLSELYSESISDRAIVESCGVVDWTVYDGDDVMTDKGFVIGDLLPLVVLLNIPLFLGTSDQMPQLDVIKTQCIAA